MQDDKMKGIFSDDTAAEIKKLTAVIAGALKDSPLATRRDLDRAEARIIKAIKGDNDDCDISAEDQRALDTLIHDGETLTLRLETLAGALSALDSQTTQ